MKQFNTGILTIILFLTLTACGGGGGSSSGDSSVGAPEDILGYSMTMNVESVEVLADTGYTNFLDPGDKAFLGFVDKNTIYGDEKFHNKLTFDDWDYTLANNTANLNIYQKDGEHRMEFNFDSSRSGSFTWEALNTSSGAHVRYNGSFSITSNSDNTGGSGSGDSGGDVSGFATTLQGSWTVPCDDGYQWTMEFSGSNIYFSPTFYEDSSCSGTGDFYHADITATYVIGDTVTTESGLTAHQIDITYTEVKYPEDYEEQEGETHYDLIYVDGDILYTGDISTGSGTSPSTRPTALDFYEPFYKD